MRTVFLGVAALALCSGAAVAVEFGVDKPFSLEVETGLGLLYGAANEHVFKAATEDSRGGEISKLEWQEQFVPTANISGRAGWYGVFLGGSLRAAVSADAGRVLDTDYQNDAEMGHYPYLYADHVSHLDSHVDLQGELGYAVHLRFPAVDLRIAPSLGYFYRNRKWAASSGYHQVAVEGETWTGSEPKENIWGQVMSYEQALSSIFAALAVDATFGTRFAAGLKGTVYPLLKADTLDNHFVQGARYYDKMEGGFAYAAALEGRWYPKRLAGTAVKLALGYESYWTADGYNLTGSIGEREDNDSTRVEGVTPKTDGTLLSASLSLVYRLGQGSL